MSWSAGDGEGGASERLIRVVRGAPTPEEIAALVGVLVRHATPAARSNVARSNATPSRWATSARPGSAGRPTDWRATGRPGIRGL